MNLGWLPSLVLFREYGGDWVAYLDALYKYFKHDFVENRPRFEGRPLGLKRHPLSHGKEATFWHMISEGASEDERRPDLRRCERIRWPRPVIEHYEEEVIKVWKNQRRGEIRICLWLENYDYLVILADRKGYLLPWTAYVVDQPHTRRKLQREFNEYRNNRSRNS
jgi:hypothetical protein